MEYIYILVFLVGLLCCVLVIQLIEVELENRNRINKLSGIVSTHIEMHLKELKKSIQNEDNAKLH